MATQTDGMIYRNNSGIDIKFDKSNLSNYKLVEPNQFVVHLRSFQGGLAASDLKGIASPAYTVLRFKDSRQATNFWKEFFRSKKFINSLVKVTYGIRDGRTIKVNDLLALKYAIPDQINEQYKIGKLISSLNDLIALYVKKSTYISSYITYFINVFFNDGNFFEQKNAHNFEKQELKLGDILIKNNAKNKDLSVLNVESISNKKGFVSQKEQFDNYQVASKDLSNYYVIHPKDFAYNPSRINVGSIAYKSPNDVKGIVSPLYVSFKCKNDIILDKYLWYWFKSANFEHQRIRLSEGGVRDTLSFNQLSKMKISIPSFKIQKQTINFLEILIQYKEEIDLKLDNLKLIKNKLLQNMFL